MALANLSFASPGRITANAAQVSAFSGSADRSPNHRVAFLSALNSLQLRRFQFNYKQKIRISFWPTRDIKVDALKEIMGGDCLSARCALTRTLHPPIRRKIHEGLELLATLDRELFGAMQLLVGAIVVARNPHFLGGSVSHIIGLIWLNPQDSWAPEAYAEHILHEYVHHALFFEQLVRSVFKYNVEHMARRTAMTVSAILRIRRGYDKAYHSAFVAYALGTFYRAIGRRHRAISLFQNANATLGGLRSRSNLLTANGLRLLQELGDKIDQVASSA